MAVMAVRVLRAQQAGVVVAAALLLAACSTAPRAGDEPGTGRSATVPVVSASPSSSSTARSASTSPSASASAPSPSPSTSASASASPDTSSLQAAVDDCGLSRSLYVDFEDDTARVFLDGAARAKPKKGLTAGEISCVLGRLGFPDGTVARLLRGKDVAASGPFVISAIYAHDWGLNVFVSDLGAS